MLNRSADKSAAAIAKLKQEFGPSTGGFQPPSGLSARRLEAADTVSFVRMDLAVLDSVREAAAEVLRMVPGIDAL